MLKSSISVMLKCFGGEAVHVSLNFNFVHNGKVTLYFNGEEKYSVTYKCLQTWYGRSNMVTRVYTYAGTLYIPLQMCPWVCAHWSPICTRKYVRTLIQVMLDSHISGRIHATSLT